MCRRAARRVSPRLLCRAPCRAARQRLHRLLAGLPPPRSAALRSRHCPSTARYGCRTRRPSRSPGRRDDEARAWMPAYPVPGGAMAGGGALRARTRARSRACRVASRARNAPAVTDAETCGKVLVWDAHRGGPPVEAKEWISPSRGRRGSEVRRVRRGIRPEVLPVHLRRPHPRTADGRRPRQHLQLVAAPGVRRRSVPSTLFVNVRCVEPVVSWHMSTE